MIDTEYDIIIAEHFQKTPLTRRRHNKPIRKRDIKQFDEQSITSPTDAIVFTSLTPNSTEEYRVGFRGENNTYVELTHEQAYQASMRGLIRVYPRFNNTVEFVTDVAKSYTFDQWYGKIHNRQDFITANDMYALARCNAVTCELKRKHINRDFKTAVVRLIECEANESDNLMKYALRGNVGKRAINLIAEYL